MGELRRLTRRRDESRQWNGIPATVVLAALHRHTAGPLTCDDALVRVVPGYSDSAVKRRIAHSIINEVDGMWPGLTVSVTLSEVSTVGDLVDEIIDHVVAWFGE